MGLETCVSLIFAVIILACVIMPFSKEKYKVVTEHTKIRDRDKLFDLASSKVNYDLILLESGEINATMTILKEIMPDEVQLIEARRLAKGTEGRVVLKRASLDDIKEAVSKINSSADDVHPYGVGVWGVKCNFINSDNVLDANMLDISLFV